MVTAPLAALRAAALTLALVCTPASGAVQPTAAPMNVVVLVIDDTRWDSIGASGNRIVRTPRLDALAADGVRFTQARVTSAICMTSRATLLTGQYMSRHGIDRFGKQLTPEAFTKSYPGVLRAAGYWTGYVGKYDVGAARSERQPRPRTDAVRSEKWHFPSYDRNPRRLAVGPGFPS